MSGLDQRTRNHSQLNAHSHIDGLLLDNALYRICSACSAVQCFWVAPDDLIEHIAR